MLYSPDPPFLFGGGSGYETKVNVMDNCLRMACIGNTRETPYAIGHTDYGPSPLMIMSVKVLIGAMFLYLCYTLVLHSSSFTPFLCLVCTTHMNIYMNSPAN